MDNLVTLIMAAGKGTRMKSDLPKVVHKINNRPMVHYVIDLAEELESQKIILIIGHKKELVEHACADMGVSFAVQEPQLGTGHAVLITEPYLQNYNGDVLVLSGDVPLLTYETLLSLKEEHQKEDATATLLTADLENPTGYGRVMRDGAAYVKKIVEHKDADEEELKVKEINVGIYIFKSKPLFRALKMINNDNAQGEYYLPDVVPIFLSDENKVRAVKTPHFNETRGINDVHQLKTAETILKKRS